MKEITVTHRFRYDVGDVLRMNTPYDTGYRYTIVGHDFSKGMFGYLITSTMDRPGERPMFRPVADIDPDWAYLLMEEK